MANNNTKARKREWHKQMKKQGFPTPVFKKKAKPFPRPNKDADMSMSTQRKMFYGI